MASVDFTFTILDIGELLEILKEALDAVPSWEREALRVRLEAIIDHAKTERERRRRS